MLLIIVPALAALALLIIALARQSRPRATPTHCRCGRKADVFDHDRPWIVHCGRCWLKKKGVAAE